MMNEFKYINWIQKQIKYPPSVFIKSGDDAAAIRLNKNRFLLVTTDVIVEGIDFLRNKTSGFDIGYKSLAISLSDLAAMGGAADSLYAVATVALRPKMPNRFAQSLFRGMKKAADKFQVTIIGGDVSVVQGPTSISSTIMGIGQKLKPLTRSGARTGDAIMVTGQLGGSILGKHLRFTPRLKEARHLNRKYRINAMSDISDGCLADLDHILKKSKKSAVLFANRIPISRATWQLSRQTKKLALKHALTDGEDFELLFTCPVKEALKILKDRSLAVPVTLIGIIGTGQGIFLQDVRGKIKKIKPKGYEHKL